MFTRVPIDWTPGVVVGLAFHSLRNMFKNIIHSLVLTLGDTIWRMLDTITNNLWSHISLWQVQSNVSSIQHVLE